MQNDIHYIGIQIFSHANHLHLINSAILIWQVDFCRILSAQQF